MCPVAWSSTWLSSAAVRNHLQWSRQNRGRTAAGRGSCRRRDRVAGQLRRVGPSRTDRAGTHCRTRAGIRLATDETGLWRKFGVPLSTLHFLRSPNLLPRSGCGLQFHTSWNRDPRPRLLYRPVGQPCADFPAALGRHFWTSAAGSGHLAASGCSRPLHRQVVCAGPCPRNPSVLDHYKLPAQTIATSPADRSCHGQHIFP